MKKALGVLSMNIEFTNCPKFNATQNSQTPKKVICKYPGHDTILTIVFKFILKVLQLLQLVPKTAHKNKHYISKYFINILPTKSHNNHSS